MYESVYARCSCVYIPCFDMYWTFLVVYIFGRRGIMDPSSI